MKDLNCHHKLMTLVSKSLPAVDLGFSQGAPTLGGGIRFFKTIPKNCMELKKIGSGRGVRPPTPPPDAPLVSRTTLLRIIVCIQKIKYWKDFYELFNWNNRSNGKSLKIMKICLSEEVLSCFLDTLVPFLHLHHSAVDRTAYITHIIYPTQVPNQPWPP